MKNTIERHETFYSQEEAAAFAAQHEGAEITAREGHPISLHGEWMYPTPEARPSWTVWWDEEIENEEEK